MRCAYCDEIINPGDTYYSFDDGNVCEDCLDEYLHDYAVDHRETCNEEEIEEDPRMESWAEWRGEK